MGQVAQPGFKSVPAESLISDLITQAGGPTANAKISAARIERGTERILDGQALQEAIAEGRTLDQMSLRSGDQLNLPENKSGGGFLRYAAMLPAAIIAIMQIF